MVLLETVERLGSYANGMGWNAIMNGNFDVWQRGTSKTLTDTVGGFLADRWNEYPADDGGTLPTLSRSRSNTSGIVGTYYTSRLNANGAGTSLGANARHWYWQSIENGTRYLCGAGRFVTVSFYARSFIANKKLGVFMQQTYGSGGSPSTTEVLTGTNWTLTSDWVRYSYTFATNTLAGKTFGTSDNDTLTVVFQYMWGTGTYSGYVGSSGVAESYVGSGNIDIAQVQVSAGSESLPYIPKTYSQEYYDCLRYYEKSYDYGTALGTATFAGAERVTIQTAYLLYKMNFPFSVRKRIAPTVTIYSLNSATGAVSEFNAASAYIADRALQAGSPYTTNRDFWIILNNNGTAGNHAAFHWTAECEL